MVQLIVGVKGEGKTKKMLEHVHNILASTDGNVVYLDKSTQNMHELDNRVRLINVTEYPIQNTDQFIGFVCGICSQDYDLQEIYLDGFLKIAKLEGQDISFGENRDIGNRRGRFRCLGLSGFGRRHF